MVSPLRAITLELNQEYTELEVDQVVDIPGRRLTKREFKLNSNLADLAASITVVTKQQLDDTGALDINDVFLYMANTEGAGTYTPSAQAPSSRNMFSPLARPSTATGA